MPLPVIHSFVGYSIYRLAERRRRKRNWALAALCVFLANLADFDFIPGLFVGQGTLFHRGLSHSMGAALLVGFLAAFFGIVMAEVSFKRLFLLSTAVYFSHPLLDFWSGPTAPIPLLWPLSHALVSTPIPFYAPMHASLHSVTSIQSLILWFLSPETMRIIFYEMAIVFSLLAIAALIEDGKKGIHPRQSQALIRLAQALIFFTGFVVT